MLRKTLIALAAAASLALLAPGNATARGFGGGGFHGGFYRGHGFGYGVGGVALGLGLGYGLYGPYGYYGYPYYASDGGYYGGCYFVPRRVFTPFGWRIRRVEVCG
jgi:hypothetical protein